MGVDEAMQCVPALRALEPAERGRVAQCSSTSLWVEGESLWARGDAAHALTYVAQGRIKLVLHREQRRPVTVRFVGPGRLVCGPAVCLAAPYCCSAEVVDDARLVTIPRDAVFATPEFAPQTLARGLTHDLASIGMELCQRMREVTADSVKRRVATVLVRLADAEGTSCTEGVVVAGSLSRSELASLCNTSTETLIRTLGELESEGAVTKMGTHAVAVNIVHLDAIARTP